MVNDKAKKMIVWVSGIVVVYCLVSLFLATLFFSIYFDRNDLRADHLEISYSSIPKEEYPREQFQFFSGKNILTGYLYNGNSKKGVIIFAHGIEGGADTYLTSIMYFVDQGWSVFAFDGTGTRTSTGIGIRGLSQTKLDVKSALCFLEEHVRFKDIPKLLYGHSMGGYAVTAILSEDINVDAVVSLAPFNSPNQLMLYQSNKIIGPLAYLEFPFLTLQNRFVFGNDANTIAVESINNTNIPILVIFGSEDEVIPAEQVGIYAFKDEITNSQVVFLEVDEEFRNKHMTLWLTQEAAEYALYIWSQYAKLKDKFGGEVPEKEFEKFYNRVDLWKMSEVDEKLMATISQFYENALTGKE
ncbi:alpha/beta hydrolase [Streptococcus ovis]